MSRNRAAYMREYRARKKAHDAGDRTVLDSFRALQERNAELVEEVRHLKAELAARHAGQQTAAAIRDRDTFNSRPFTPVPKIRK